MTDNYTGIKREYYTNGSIRSEFYHINGKLHREDGPSDIGYFKDGSIRSEFYHINGKLHREDGPAIIIYNEDGRILYNTYYLNGTEHKKEQYEYLVSLGVNTPLFDMALEMMK